uniref:Uncharacterized protein n=1 Tax=Arundo donax TaxID=35708 RepID=A0A0A9BRF7_ARUDO
MELSPIYTSYFHTW